MKRLFFLGFFFVLLSCKERNRNTSPVDDNKTVPQTVADEKIVDAEKDKNGCLANVGYVWSKVKKDCIKIYDVAVPLSPVDNLNTEDELLFVYFIFNGDQSMAEVYFPNTVESVLFEKKEKSKWTYANWDLQSQADGYVLKKDNVIVFKGDGEIGVKVTGSDRLEED